jgi:VCBS repeat-containing protein
MRRKPRSLIARLQAWLRPRHAPAPVYQGQIEELEPRILFSADPPQALLLGGLAPCIDKSDMVSAPPLTVQARPGAVTHEAPTTTSCSPTQQATPVELVIVDRSVPQAEALADALQQANRDGRALEVHWLEADQDGVDQISALLQGRHDVSALHLISHGSDGALQLGAITLNGQTLHRYADQLSSWRQELASDVDILLYGCDVAADATGRAFVDDLRLLTGADLAASEDLTGSAELGGNWDLEYAAGQIQTPTVLQASLMADWHGLLATYTVTSTADTLTAGTLRYAITQANLNAGADTIDFAITGAAGSYGEYTISLTSALPNITDAVTIDGSTQSGYSATGVHTVVIDANGLAGNGFDLTATADGSVIRGLVIRDFTSYGVFIETGSAGNTIVGNYIGSFNADGSNAGTTEKNLTGGIYTRGANTVIGGTTAADRNVISGNDNYNIYLATDADGTVIKGNYIGTDATGTSIFSTTNPNYGIMVETSATNITIGGTATGAGNVISGHLREGIWVTTTGTVTIQGNYIGTNAAGTADLGNTRYGIYLDDTGSALIGGTATGAGNVISGNDLGGIYASNGSVTVQGNTIGLNASGTAALANSGAGIELRTNSISTIGGNGSGYRNIISGNTGYGIQVETSPAGGHVIKGNYIGLAADGSTLIGNGSAGIYVNASYVNIGGKTAGDGNTIAGNGGAGIAVASGTNTLYYRNAIYSNTGLGIDLGNNGVTLNDDGDGDGGANYYNNFPVITSVVTNGSTTTITGSIDWYQGGDTIYVELFSNPSADASGYGEGRTYLGAVQVTTTAGTGDAHFSVTVSGVSVGDWITAVANVETSYIGASEFSKAVQAVAPANAPRGRVIWNNNDQLFQRYADWSTGGFGGIGTNGLNLTDDISMITAVEAPTRNEILFIGSADASGKILAAFWNGSSWSSVISVPLASPSATAQYYNSFAAAYDQVSGNAMLVWDNGNTGTTGLSYATWDGSSWSATSTITAPVSGEPLHMKLAASPIGHDMVLAVSTSAASNNQYAVVWNGSSWGNSQALGTNSSQQYFEMNVAYEQQSGRAMVVYDNSAANSADVQYRVWSGSAWSSESSIGVASGVTSSSELYSTAIASDPGSNRIAIAAKDAANEVWLAVWDGSSWGSKQLATTSGVDLPEHHATMAVAFERQSGDLLAVYGKASGPNVYYRTWTQAGGWSAEATGPSVGGTDVPNVSKLYADPYSNTIMLGVQDNAYDLNFVAWDGSAWGAVTELDYNTVFSFRESFTFVWFQNAPVIANLSGDTLSFTEDQSAQVIDQGTAASVTMGDETGYNGGNLTVSFTAGSTAGEDVLGIRNQGNGASQIGVSGSNVTYGGTTIGTYTGGTGGSDLVITFNSSASNAAVTALAKNITYQNTNTSAPSTTNRTVKFVVTNAQGQASQAANATVTVARVNDAPTTNNVSASGNEDNTITGTVTGSDVDGDSLTFSKATNPTHGSVTVNSDGTFSYAPTANFNGTDSFTVTVSDGNGGTATSTVTITVNPVNDAPTTNNVGASGNEDTTITGTVTGADVDGDALIFSKATNPTHGSVTVNSDGTFSYIPTANFNGTDSFTVTVSDGNGGTATSTVTITVNAVNDTPTTNNVSASGNEDTTIAGTVTGSDVDGDSLTFSKATNPSHGTVTVNSDGTFSYSPTANFNGTDSFTVTVSDGNGGTATSTVTITVNAVNGAPTTNNVSASGNEDTTITGTVTGSDVDGDSLSFSKATNPSHGAVTVNSDGTFSYSPTANFNGTDSFTVTVSDGNGGTATSTVTITVNPVNDAPTTNNVSVSGNEDTTITGTVTGSDVDGDALTFSKATDPNLGAVTVNSDGTFSYAPTANFNGTDSFTVTVSDGNGGTATSTVTITVNPVNDAPTTNNVSVSGNEDTTITGTVTGSDVDGDALNFSKATNPTHGSVTVNSDGTFSYSPTANFNGTDSFTVTVSDGNGGTATSTVTITVNPVNDAPTTNNVSVSGKDRKSTRLNSSHRLTSRMPSSA